MAQDSILKAIGNTACVQLRGLSDAGVKLYAKLEYLTPSLGIADRLALCVVEQLEHDGKLKTGDTIACVGGDGWEVALGLICAQKGLKLAVVLAEHSNPLDEEYLKLAGATVLHVPQPRAPQPPLSESNNLAVAARELAKTTAKARGWHFVEKDRRADNGKQYFDSTIFELLDTFGDNHIDYLIVPGQYALLNDLFNEQIHRASPATRMVVSQLQYADTRSAELLIDNHILQRGLTSRSAVQVPVSQAAANRGRLNALTKEGLLIGLHSGAALATAQAIAEQAHFPCNIAILFTDAPHSPLHDLPSTHTTSTERDEIDEILGMPRLAEALSSADDLPVMDVREVDALLADVTLEMLKQLIRRPGKPVVMFGLEGCEFCWAVRKFFRQLSIPVHCVDLDSTSYRPVRLGAKMRATLTAYTGNTALPQIFINGEYIGSHLELFDMISNRNLFKKLDQAGINYNRVLDVDPYTLLPGWTRASTTST